ncbi:unnamed protein product, partial [Mesorhabditis spiculigera]
MKSSARPVAKQRSTSSCASAILRSLFKNKEAMDSLRSLQSTGSLAEAKNVQECLQQPKASQVPDVSVGNALPHLVQAFAAGEKHLLSHVQRCHLSQLIERRIGQPTVGCYLGRIKPGQLDNRFVQSYGCTQCSQPVTLS